VDTRIWVAGIAITMCGSGAPNPYPARAACHGKAARLVDDLHFDPGKQMANLAPLEIERFDRAGGSDSAFLGGIADHHAGANAPAYLFGESRGQPGADTDDKLKRRKTFGIVRAIFREVGKLQRRAKQSLHAVQGKPSNASRQVLVRKREQPAVRQRAHQNAISEPNIDADAAEPSCRPLEHLTVGRILIQYSLGNYAMRQGHGFGTACRSRSECDAAEIVRRIRINGDGRVQIAGRLKPVSGDAQYGAADRRRIAVG